MKHIIDLTHSIADENFFEEQFNIQREKNILFVNPQLSAKQLYKTFLPYHVLYSNTIATAIQHISKYNPMGQLLGGKEVDVSDKMITWATHIVLPFSSQPFMPGLYGRIRRMNPECKVIYNIDFNFYELRPKNPYYEIFKEPSILSAVEDNILFCDKAIVSNVELHKYMVDKFSKIVQDKINSGEFWLDVGAGMAYDSVTNLPIKLGFQATPFMVDSELMMANVDYNPEELVQYKKEEVKESTHPAIIQERLEETAKKAAEVTAKKQEEKREEKAKTAKKVRKIAAKIEKKKQNGANNGKSEHIVNKHKNGTKQPESKSAAKSGTFKRNAGRPKNSGKPAKRTKK